MDDEETLSAYHEAGHAVIGYGLGGRIESVTLGGDGSDDLPERFGDCRVNWGRVDATTDWQLQREILTLLAGPVAEMIYRGEPLHPAFVPEWRQDWDAAISRALSVTRSERAGVRLVESLVAELHQRMKADAVWAAIAAVADELLAHEYLEEDQLAETLSFWIRRNAS